jgi:hypothetical protein
MPVNEILMGRPFLSKAFASVSSLKRGRGRKDEGWWRDKRECFLRGGNWNNGSNAGAFAANLNWSGSTSNNNVGFRCARYLSHRFGLNEISKDIIF